MMYHDIKGSIKQTAGQTADYKCQQTIQPSSWPSFQGHPQNTNHYDEANPPLVRLLHRLQP